MLLLVGYRLGSGVSLGERGGTVSVSDAEVCLRRGSTIYFTAILGTEEYLKKLGAWEDVEPRAKRAQAFVLNATAHVGTIRQLSLDNKVFLVAEGVRYPSVGRVLGLTTHHDTYLVFFPRYDMQGQPLFEKTSGSFDIVIEFGDVDPILPQRVLTFQYPLPKTGAVGSDITRLVMLLGAVLAALLLTCTPCLVGSMMVGSLTMSTAEGLSTPAALPQMRTEMVRKTLYYLAALIIAYLTVAMVVNIYNLKAEDLRPVELLGGLFLLGMGLYFLRSWGPLARLERLLLNRLMRLPLVSQFVTRNSQFAIGSEASSAMGASLAMVCSVAGAPTLSTAIILPVMIYAGLNDLSWSFLVLLVYLLVCALPFFLITVGLGEFLLTASLRFRHRLLVANAFLLIGLGLLLVFSPQAMADTLSAPARLLLTPFRWLF